MEVVALKNQEALKRLAALTVAPAIPALYFLWVMIRAGMATGEKDFPRFRKELDACIDPYIIFKREEKSIEKRKSFVKLIWDQMFSTKNMPTFLYKVSVEVKGKLSTTLFSLKQEMMDIFSHADDRPWLNRVAPLLTVGDTIESLSTGKVPRAIKNVAEAKSKL